MSKKNNRLILVQVYRDSHKPGKYVVCLRIKELNYTRKLSFKDTILFGERIDNLKAAVIQAVQLDPSIIKDGYKLVEDIVNKCVYSDYKVDQVIDESNPNYNIKELSTTREITSKSEFTKLEFEKIQNSFIDRMKDESFYLDKQELFLKSSNGIELYDKVKFSFKYIPYSKNLNNVRVEHLNPNKQLRKYLIIQDFHIPYQHDKIIYGLIKWADDMGFYGIILNGDILDADYYSSYTTNLNIINKDHIQNQINEAGDLLRYIDTQCNFKHKILGEGNHEDRISRSIFGDGINGKYIKKYDSDNDFYSLATLLSLNESRDIVKWELYRYKERININNWIIQHGEQYGLHIVPSKIKENIAEGHTHRAGHVTNILINGDGTLTTYQHIRFGCLIDIEGYSKIPRMSYEQLFTWVNGFGILVTDGEKTHVNTYIIDNNSCFVDGCLLDFNTVDIKKIKSTIRTN